MITDFLFLPGIAATIMEKLVLFLDIDVQLQIRTYPVPKIQSMLSTSFQSKSSSICSEESNTYNTNNNGGFIFMSSYSG